jgi:hypothetical protein
MTGSLATLTAAMIDAQIASVELKRSLVRPSSSRILARLIPPMTARFLHHQKEGQPSGEDFGGQLLPVFATKGW